MQTNNLNFIFHHFNPINIFNKILTRLLVFYGDNQNDLISHKIREVKQLGYCCENMEVWKV